MKPIRTAILGYGNVGRGVEMALSQNEDLVLSAVFTHRDPTFLTLASSDVPVCPISDLEDGAAADIFDVLVICSGSATDLPEQTPHFAQWYNVVDSFDTHAHIPEHFENVDAQARATEHVALISTGWDPGLFSLARLFGDCVLPKGESYTFWGRGISQGHSDALRRIPGVADARQYTVPRPEALKAARSGENPLLTTRQMHTRECWVVLEPHADPDAVKKQIVTMPDYFADYDVTVNFISQAELDRDHGAMPHGGFVLRGGESAAGNKQMMEYSLTLASNPEFTGSVLACYARAVARLAFEGQFGCKTVFDVAPAYLSARSGASLRAHLL